MGFLPSIAGRAVLGLALSRPGTMNFRALRVSAMLRPTFADFAAELKEDLEALDRVFGRPATYDALSLTGD